MTELGDNEEIIGELVETPYFSVGDSEIRRGDAIAFKLRQSALTAQVDDVLDRALATTQGSGVLVGEVIAVLPGCEQCYLVKILSRAHPQLSRKSLFVAKRDLLKVVTASELSEGVGQRGQGDADNAEE